MSFEDFIDIFCILIGLVVVGLILYNVFYL